MTETVGVTPRAPRRDPATRPKAPIDVTRAEPTPMHAPRRPLATPRASPVTPGQLLRAMLLVLVGLVLVQSPQSLHAHAAINLVGAPTANR